MHMLSRNNLSFKICVKLFFVYTCLVLSPMFTKCISYGHLWVWQKMLRAWSLCEFCHVPTILWYLFSIFFAVLSHLSLFFSGLGKIGFRNSLILAWPYYQLTNSITYIKYALLCISFTSACFRVPSISSHGLPPVQLAEFTPVRAYILLSILIPKHKLVPQLRLFSCTPLSSSQRIPIGSALEIPARQ